MDLYWQAILTALGVMLFGLLLIKISEFIPQENPVGHLAYCVSYWFGFIYYIIGCVGGALIIVFGFHQEFFGSPEIGDFPDLPMAAS